ncbi:MAG: hypothetical protein N4A53_13380 [Pelagimonas sp.]|nr:hypothetical protein [Pelagimonas sp.]
MRAWLMAACLLLPCGAWAEDWQALADAEIRSALADQRLTYGSAWQEFYASGRTLYNAEQDSWGDWAARGDQYCSQWPPAGGWACYDVLRLGDRIRFVGDSGDVTDGVLARE